MDSEYHKEPQQGRLRKIVIHPVSRMIIGLVFVFGSVILFQVTVQVIKQTFYGAGKLPLYAGILVYSVMTILVILAYFVFVRWVERRPLRELSKPGAVKELGLGAAIGFILILSSTAILWVLGYYQVSAISMVTVLLKPFFDSLFAGFFEEIAFRGVIFRIINESLGSWLAVLISALIFGFAHAFNPNASLFSSIAIAIEAGVLLSTAYLFTGRLWMVIGIHFAWNFTEGGILGITVSGQKVEGLLISSLEGPELLTGGEFGAETSIVTIIICLSAGLFFLWKAHQRGNFKAPFWIRNKSRSSEAH
jgi:hypothetical protein